MARTLVQNPESYVGLAVSRKFNDGVVYDGNIVSYYDPKQFWRVTYPCDGQEEEDWAVPEMKNMSEVLCAALSLMARQSARRTRRENEYEIGAGAVDAALQRTPRAK